VSDPLTFDWRDVLLVLTLPTLGFLLVLFFRRGRRRRRPSVTLLSDLAADDAAKTWEACRHCFHYLSVPQQQALQEDLPLFAAVARREHHAAFRAAINRPPPPRRLLWAASPHQGHPAYQEAPSDLNAPQRLRHDYAWMVTNFLGDLVQDVLSDTELVEFRAQAYGVVTVDMELFGDVIGGFHARWRQPQRN
jgi:hypothetical protein